MAKVNWNHVLDEWEGLRVHKTMVLKLTLVVRRETIQFLHLCLAQLYTITVHLYGQYARVKWLWTGQELGGGGA